MIGIFDSGCGGLTVMRAIRQRLPHSDIIYFGDIKNAPYGFKSPEELLKLTLDAIKLLREEGATSIVSACNSISTNLAVSLYDALELAPAELIEMVGPTVSAAKNFKTNLLLVATPATVRSGIYQNAFNLIGKEITAVSMPELASLIEFGASDEVLENNIRAALAMIDFSHVDVLVLACTHYPLAYDVFRRIVPQNTLIFDPAFAVAERVEKQFWPREAGEGKTRFLISKDSDYFRRLAKQFFDAKDAEIEVLQ